MSVHKDAKTSTMFVKTGKGIFNTLRKRNRVGPIQSTPVQPVNTSNAKEEYTLLKDAQPPKANTSKENKGWQVLDLTLQHAPINAQTQKSIAKALVYDKDLADLRSKIVNKIQKNLDGADRWTFMMSKIIRAFIQKVIDLTKVLEKNSYCVIFVMYKPYVKETCLMLRNDGKGKSYLYLPAGKWTRKKHIFTREMHISLEMLEYDLHERTISKMLYRYFAYERNYGNYAQHHKVQQVTTQ